MPKPQVVILHGWSDDSSSFRPLAKYLKANGYDAVPVWLGDYISMDDDVRVEDVAKRLAQVVRQKMAAGTLKTGFALIVHSTGALVAREWIATCYGDNAAACPAKKLIMLAPANFGSRLAAKGKGMLGRVVKGYNNWFHTGKEMLNALELASPYQWALAERDLFVPEGQTTAPALYGVGKVLPFVITGTHPYTGRLQQLVNEDGADGTVRVPAANLNVRGMTIDFAANEAAPVLTDWALRGQPDVPMAVLPDRHHSSIYTPEKNDVAPAPVLDGDVGPLILSALGCRTITQYRALYDKWWQLSEATAALVGEGGIRKQAFRKKASADYFHQYMQMNVRVVDDYGNQVENYFLEFSGPEGRSKEDSMVYFHKQVLEHTHVNKTNESYSCLYMDRTDLYHGFYGTIARGAKKALRMRISVAPPGNNTHYFGDYTKGAKGAVHLHVQPEGANHPRWFRRNSTHFIKIIIPRMPNADVFTLKKA